MLPKVSVASLLNKNTENAYAGPYQGTRIWLLHLDHMPARLANRFEKVRAHAQEHPPKTAENIMARVKAYKTFKPTGTTKTVAYNEDIAFNIKVLSYLFAHGFDVLYDDGKTPAGIFKDGERVGAIMPVCFDPFRDIPVE